MRRVPTVANFATVQNERNRYIKPMDQWAHTADDRSKSAVSGKIHPLSADYIYVYFAESYAFAISTRIKRVLEISRYTLKQIRAKSA
jgi:hypothetical protein